MNVKRPQAKLQPSADKGHSGLGPYIMPVLPHGRRFARQALPVRHSIIRSRAQTGPHLVAVAQLKRPKAKHFWSGWLEQKHLDRGFLVLAASSALLLLLSAR